MHLIVRFVINLSYTKVWSVNKRRVREEKPLTAFRPAVSKKCGCLMDFYTVFKMEESSQRKHRISMGEQPGSNADWQCININVILVMATAQTKMLEGKACKFNPEGLNLSFLKRRDKLAVKQSSDHDR